VVLFAFFHCGKHFLLLPTFHNEYSKCNNGATFAHNFGL
jgi:hypothetical protein